jgi:hypothetical protein
MSEWKQVGGGGNAKMSDRTWKFEKDGDEVSGVLIDFRENTGAENKSTVYSLQQPDGTVTAVWGTDVLDRRLKTITLGHEVRIVYHGKVKNPKTQRSYHNFDVYEREPQQEDF